MNTELILNKELNIIENVACDNVFLGIVIIDTNYYLRVNDLLFEIIFKDKETRQLHNITIDDARVAYFSIGGALFNWQYVPMYNGNSVLEDMQIKFASIVRNGDDIGFEMLTHAVFDSQDNSFAKFSLYLTKYYVSVKLSTGTMILEQIMFNCEQTTVEQVTLVDSIDLDTKYLIFGGSDIVLRV